MDIVEQVLSPEMVAELETAPLKKQLAMATRYRQLMSQSENPPIDRIIASGLVPVFINFLYREDSPELQFEAAWVLSNVAGGNSEQTRTVISYGAVPMLIRTLQTAGVDVQEQSVWALSNISGDCWQARDQVLAAGILSPLLTLVTAHPDRLTLLRSVVWCLSNLCRKYQGVSVEFGLVRPALPTLTRLIHHQDNKVGSLNKHILEVELFAKIFLDIAEKASF